MDGLLQFIIILAALLLFAKLAGYVSTLLGQPSVLGELIVGVLLGPTLLNILHLHFLTNASFISEAIRDLAQIGVLLLMFLAGLDLHLKELRKQASLATIAGSMGVILSIAGGTLISLAFGYNLLHSTFLGLCIAATSVTISAQILMDLNFLRSKVGVGLLATAVFDDIFVITLLALFLAVFLGTGTWQTMLITTGWVLLFLLLAGGFGLWLIPKASRWFKTLPVSYLLVTFAVIILLLYSFFAELTGGLSAILGAFLAGLMFARVPEKAEIAAGLKPLAYAFFVPIFFVDIGLEINLVQLPLKELGLVALLVVIAILGKFLGIGLGAKLNRFSWRDALMLGVGMISRGEVCLILARAGQHLGIIGPEMVSAVVIVVMITSVVTPPLLKLTTPRQSPSGKPLKKVKVA
jgi:Kef-type K+ transport system membrane component KefB